MLDESPHSFFSFFLTSSHHAHFYIYVSSFKYPILFCFNFFFSIYYLIYPRIPNNRLIHDHMTNPQINYA